MKGKVILITGATNGIGLEAARALARMGAKLVLVGRNPEKTGTIVNDLKAETGNNEISALIGDLSLQADVRRVADEFKSKFDRLDVLINNAGAFYNEYHTTREGYEMTFALNHLSYFLLTHLLLDVIKDSAPARIVNVSSDAHQFGGIDFDNLQGEKGYGGMRAYGMSKLENILFTYELARRLQGTGVTVNALHPGFVRTGFGRNNGGWLNGVMKFVQMFALTPEQGADTIIYLASSPEVANVSGKYFVKRKPKSTSAAANNEANWKRLWEISETLTGIKDAVTV